MKLIHIRHWEDFGHEFTLKLLLLRGFCLFNLDIHHSDYFDWKDVNLNASVSILGRCNIFAMHLEAWNVSADLGFFNQYFYNVD